MQVSHSRAGWEPLWREPAEAGGLDEVKLRDDMGAGHGVLAR